MAQKNIVLRAAALMLTFSLCFQQAGIPVLAEDVEEESVEVQEDSSEEADSDIEGEVTLFESINSENAGVGDFEGDDAGVSNDSDSFDLDRQYGPEEDPQNVDSTADDALTTGDNNEAESIEERTEESSAEDVDENAAEDVDENAAASAAENPIEIEETAEEEFTESFSLLQQGDFVTEHYASPSQNKRKFRSGRTDTLRTRISSAMADLEQMVEVEDLGFLAPDDRDTVISVYRSCIRPESFYISSGFSYYKNKETGIITRIKIGYTDEYLDSSGIPDTDRIEEDVQSFKRRAAEAVDYAGQGADTLERLLLAHDWIVRECDYDYENWKSGDLPAQSFSAFGCLVKGTAVCNGYALAYACLLSELGYESYILASDEMNHAWNFVCIDSHWLHVDLTWDDPPFTNKKTGWGYLNEDYVDEGFVSHKYFLKSDREIENLSHSGWYDQIEGLEVPSSDTDGMFDDAVFHDTFFTAFNYLDEKFYYCDDYGKVWVSDDLWGKGKKEFTTSSSETHYLHVCDGKLFYTDASVIYMYSPGRGEIICVDEGGLVISEMVIKENHLIYITLDNGISARHRSDTNVQQVGFSDVPHTYVFYHQIKWAFEQGIISGYEDGTFKPHGDCKRKQAVDFLWRLRDTPAPLSANSMFRDVNPKTDFFQGIYWAAENHIVLGFGDGTFRPDAACTRGQFVALLWRLAGRPAAGKKVSNFKDVNQNDSFYKAIIWAAEKGIAQGYSDGTFRPDCNCTRGQIAAFIYRYVKMQ